MYEAVQQEEPVLDCKGIEIVRRDTCPIVAKTFESTLKLLFRRKDVSAVKRYLTRQLTKIMEDRLPLQDYIFAKEVKFGSYARENSLPPAAVVASRMMIEVARTRASYDAKHC
jgi:DNA polymerase zeta